MIPFVNSEVAARWLQVWHELVFSLCEKNPDPMQGDDKKDHQVHWIWMSNHAVNSLIKLILKIDFQLEDGFNLIASRQTNYLHENLSNEYFIELTTFRHNCYCKGLYKRNSWRFRGRSQLLPTSLKYIVVKYIKMNTSSFTIDNKEDMIRN